MQNVPEFRLNGYGGILETVFADIYRDFHPHFLFAKTQLLEDVQYSDDVRICTSLEMSKHYRGMPNEDSEQMKLVEPFIVYDCGFFFNFDSKIKIDRREIMLKDLLPSVLQFEDVSNYAIEALVYLLQFGSKYNGEIIIPLNGRMTTYNDVQLKVATLKLNDTKDMQCDIVTDVYSLRQLSDLHIYYFFLSRNMYISCCHRLEPLHEFDNFKEIEEDDVEFFREKMHLMSIRNIIYIRGTLLVLSQWFLPARTRNFEQHYIYPSATTLFVWYPLNRLKDWKMVFFYFRQRCPSIKDNYDLSETKRLYKKNFIGLFEPTLTDSEYFEKSKDWDHIRTIHPSCLNQEYEETIIRFEKCYDPIVKQNYGFFSDYEEAYLFYVKPYLKVVSKKSQQQSAEVEEAQDPLDSLRKRRLILDSESIGSSKKRKKADLREIQSDLEFIDGKVSVSLSSFMTFIQLWHKVVQFQRTSKKDLRS